MVAEVRADVGDAQALAGAQARCRGVRQARHAQPQRGLQAAVRVPAEQLVRGVMPRPAGYWLDRLMLVHEDRSVWLHILTDDPRQEQSASQQQASS